MSYISRKEFITKITGDFNNNILSFNLDNLESESIYTKDDDLNIINTIKKNKEIKNILNLLEIDLFKDIKNLETIIDLFDLKKDIDYYLLEKDVFQYNISLNLNKVYDQYVILNDTDKNNKTIYRIENKNGESIYGNISFDNCLENNPAPENDKNISSIFSSVDNIDYKREWFFGFKNKNQIKKWFLNKENFNKLINKGALIVSYKVPKDFIIESDKQLIFKKEQAKIIRKQNIDNKFFNSKKLKV